MLPSLPILLVFALQPLVAPDPVPVAAAEKAFQAGVTALEQDRFEEAMGHFQVCLRLDPALAKAHLNLAAAHLALGQDPQAGAQLSHYLEARPSDFLIRQSYAEVLTRLNRFEEAADQLDRFLRDLQDSPSLAEEHLLPGHTKRMEIAARLGDDYAEKLHRGIGLFLLAKKRLDIDEPASRRIGEELLCKSAGELMLARVARPREARPNYYLYEVWHCLGQRQPADRALREAVGLSGWSDLTPREVRNLHLADQSRSIELLKR
ncbi:MAG: tetratricopeptide repeat protein [Gemmataceae bacterium]